MKSLYRLWVALGIFTGSLRSRVGGPLSGFLEYSHPTKNNSLPYSYWVWIKVYLTWMHKDPPKPVSPSLSVSVQTLEDSQDYDSKNPVFMDELPSAAQIYHRLHATTSSRAALGQQEPVQCGCARELNRFSRLGRRSHVWAKPEVKNPIFGGIFFFLPPQGLLVKCIWLTFVCSVYNSSSITTGDVCSWLLWLSVCLWFAGMLSLSFLSLQTAEPTCTDCSISKHSAVSCKSCYNSGIIHFTA